MITVETLYNDEDLKYLLTRDDFNNIIKEELKQIKK